MGWGWLSTVTEDLRNVNFPANIYFFKVNNRNPGKRCEICSKLTLKHQNDVSDVLLFLLLILLTIVDFDQVMLAGLSFETNEYRIENNDTVFSQTVSLSLIVTPL